MQSIRRIGRYMRALLTGRIDMNKTRLQDAAFAGNLADVRLFLLQGDLVDEGDDEMSPLRLAIYSCQPEVIEVLLASGAKTEGVGIQHALASAQKRGRLDIVRMLIDAGVKIDTSVDFIKS